VAGGRAGEVTKDEADRRVGFNLMAFVTGEIPYYDRGMSRDAQTLLSA
jgi:hypothetical protein